MILLKQSRNEKPDIETTVNETLLENEILSPEIDLKFENELQWSMKFTTEIFITLTMYLTV